MHKKCLVVEGDNSDSQTITRLMCHFWPDSPVVIESGHGVNDILKKEFISTRIKDPTTEILGFLLDADTDSHARFTSFRSLCVNYFPDMPVNLPANGLVAVNKNGKRIGLWVMPDNKSNGTIEAFLKYLVPDKQIPLWQHAVKSACEAKSHGADYREGHVDKAYLYTWLAWLDKPGQSPGRALAKKILDPYASSAIPFMKWFMELYLLERSMNI